MPTTEASALKRFFTTIPQFVAVATSLAALLAVLVTYAYQQRRNEEAKEREVQVALDRALDARIQAERLAERTHELEIQLEMAAKLPAHVSGESEVGKLQVQISALRADLDRLSASVSDERNAVDSLDRAFLPDPEKALSIPLLRKDVDQIRTGNQHDIDALRDEMKENLDLNKWLIGLIAAGVVGTILSNMMQGRRGAASTQAPFE